MIQSVHRLGFFRDYPPVVNWKTMEDCIVRTFSSWPIKCFMEISCLKEMGMTCTICSICLEKIIIAKNPPIILKVYRYSHMGSTWIFKMTALWKGFWLYGSYMRIGIGESGQSWLVWLNHSYTGSTQNRSKSSRTWLKWGNEYNKLWKQETSGCLQMVQFD